MIENLIEVKLVESDNFLLVKETLTRIGIASRKDNTLYQSCHILFKQGRYFIVHFKEMFLLDGKKNTDFSENDIARRNTIIKLLQDWELIEVIDPSKIEDPIIPISHLKILSFKEKNNWNLVPKYNIGAKR